MALLAGVGAALSQSGFSLGAWSKPDTLRYAVFPFFQDDDIRVRLNGDQLLLDAFGNRRGHLETETVRSQPIP